MGTHLIVLITEISHENLQIFLEVPDYSKARISFVVLELLGAVPKHMLQQRGSPL